MLEVINRPQITEDMARSIKHVRRILTPKKIFHSSSASLTEFGSELQALLIKHRETISLPDSNNRGMSSEKRSELNFEVDNMCSENRFSREKLGAVELIFKAIVNERSIQLGGGKVVYEK